MEKILAYDTRFANVSTVELSPIDFQQNVDLCVLARNSDFTIVNIEDNQCTRMPQNFNSVMKKFNKRPNSIFKIFEMDKKHLGRNAIVHAASSGVRGSINNLFVILSTITISTLVLS